MKLLKKYWYVLAAVAIYFLWFSSKPLISSSKWNGYYVTFGGATYYIESGTKRLVKNYALTGHQASEIVHLTFADDTYPDGPDLN